MKIRLWLWRYKTVVVVERHHTTIWKKWATSIEAGVYTSAKPTVRFTSAVRRYGIETIDSSLTRGVLLRRRSNRPVARF